MLRLLRAWLPGVLVLCATSALFAQTSGDRYSLPKAAAATPAPPAWHDAASVYLTGHDQAAAPDEAAAPKDFPSASHRVIDDPRVAQASYRSDEPHAVADPPQRRLAPPSDALRTEAQHSSTAASSTNGWGLPLDSLVPTIGALVLVVGLFLLCMWGLRRGGRGATSQLPKDAVSVLGSTPLAGRQVAQLLRVGNKLVLVSVTPSGARPLAEVTEPGEVDRLLGLCLHGDLRTATTAYEKTFRHFSTETKLKGLSGLDSPLAQPLSGQSLSAQSQSPHSQPPSDLYRAYQGVTERA
jgi:flagellar biogenesis protein FliO